MIIRVDDNGTIKSAVLPTKTSELTNDSGFITDSETIGIENGGTGATSASGARTNLGLGTAATANTSSIVADNANLPTGAAVKAYVDDSVKYKVSLFGWTEITENADLNNTDWLITGSYISPSTEKVSTLSNIPDDLNAAFIMQVYNPAVDGPDAITGTYRYRIQEITKQDGKARWIRDAYTSSTGVWTFNNWTKAYPVDTATGDSDGQIKINGTNVSVKGWDNKLSKSGDTATGNLTLNAQNVDATLSNNGVDTVVFPTLNEIRDKNGHTLTNIEAQVKPNGNITGAWYVRNYDSSGQQVNHQGIYMHMNKNGDFSWGVDGAESFRTAIGLGSAAIKAIETTVANDANLPTGSAVQTYVTNSVSNKVSKSGDVITGSLAFNCPGVDATLSDNGVSSDVYPSTSQIRDQNGRSLSVLEAQVHPTGDVTAGWYVRNYDTSGSVKVHQGIYMNAKKDGTFEWNVNSPDKFRSAIGIPSNAVYTDTTDLTAMTGILPIAHGGTGANNVASALSNLGLTATSATITWSSNLTVYHSRCVRFGGMVILWWNVTSNASLTANTELCTLPYSSSVWTLVPFSTNDNPTRRASISGGSKVMKLETAMTSGVNSSGMAIYFTTDS